MNETRIFGRIFLPDKPNEVINGVWLNINQGSIYLETSHNTLSNQEWKIIHGEFNGLDKVTFVNSYAGAGSSGSGGTWRKIHVSYLLKNCHIKSYSELLFREISLISPAISNWINEPDGISRIDGYTYKIPEDENIFETLICGVKISLIITCSHEFSSNSLKVERKCLFRIVALELLHLFDFSELMSKIKNGYFLSQIKIPNFQPII